MKSITLFMLLSLSAVCAEQWYQITTTWKFNQTQLDLFISKLERTTTETFMYHWGDAFSGLRYAMKNYVDQEEVDILNAGSGVGGGGFYFSKDKYDSNDYGIFPTAVRLPAGTLLFNSHNSSETMPLVKILGFPSYYMSTTKKVALGAVVPFVDHYYRYYDTWRVTHSAKLLQDIMPGHVAPEPHKVELWGQTTISNQFENGAFDVLNKTKHREIFASWKDNIEEIERLFSLLNLLGPTEMNCRFGLKEDLWQGVDRQYFNSFHKLRMHVYKMIADGERIGFGYSRYGNVVAQPSALVWARNQTESVLPELHNIAYGSADNMWRGEERTVHIGNGTITVINKQLEYIEANPYLHVERVSSDGNHTKVQIWLPDVFHYNSTLVSNTTNALIQSYTLGQLASDSMLRQKLNRVLNKDMLEQMMANVFFGKNNLLDMCKQVAYLSPLADIELAKMWCYMGSIELSRAQTESPPDVIYRGMEFLLNPNTYRTDYFYNNLREGSFETVNNITMSTVLHIGDHIHKPEDKGWFTNNWNSASPFAPYFQKSFLLPIDKCEMVRQKKWTEILDEVAPSWATYI